MTTAQSVEAQVAQETQDAEELQDWGSVAVSFARQMTFPNFSRGDLAGLRRMDPDEPGAAAYWRLMAEKNLLGSAALELKWALILHGIALMTPRAGDEGDSRTAHEGYMPVGRALFLGGDANRPERGYYAESRLNRLLTARGPMLRSLLARMFRMMAAADQPFNWREMARFILNEDYDEERFEMARRRIASEYYQAERRSARTETN
ncbi:MAG: hypothetical protein F4Y35_04515 [Chloroflexi bacterium]|nr:hypothetical protein [Chloroflexota bacterium]